MFRLRVSVSQEMEILVRRKKRGTQKCLFDLFFFFYFPSSHSVSLCISSSSVVDFLISSVLSGSSSPVFFTPVYSPLFTIPFPFPPPFSFIFSTVSISPTAPLLFRLHPSSPLIFCLLLHLPSSSFLSLLSFLFPLLPFLCSLCTQKEKKLCLTSSCCYS